jgi:hypothetical protein
MGGEVPFADVVIHHTGYCDRVLRGKMLERDQRLVEVELAEQPDHPFTLFNLGSILQEQGRQAQKATRHVPSRLLWVNSQT